MLSSKPTSLASAMARSQLRRCVPTHTRISTVKNRPRHLLARTITNEKRYISNSSRLSYPRKDSQDRESINTDATEYSKSETDDKAAQQDVAFNPDLTDPQTQKKKAREENHVSSHYTFPLSACLGYQIFFLKLI